MSLRNIKNTKATMALMLWVAFVALMATGCKGRTRENMQPVGETVTVDVQTLDSIQDYGEPVLPHN